MHTITSIAQSILYRSMFVLSMSLILVAGDGWLIHAPAQGVNEPGPEFEVYSIDGRYFSSESLEGEQTLLMFWAPWCGVCRRELPKLAQYYRETGSAQMQILTIGSADSSDRVEAYVADHSDTFVFPTVYDDGNLLQGAYRVRAFPTYVLLDADGVIQMMHRGSGVLENRRFQSLVQ